MYELIFRIRISPFKAESSSCSESFKLNGKAKEAETRIKNPEKKHLVRLNGSNLSLKREFYVSYKYFENMNKSVFVFVDKNEENLKKINHLTSELIQKLQDNDLSFVIQKELEEILKLTMAR